MQFKDKQEENATVDGGDSMSISQKISADRDAKQTHSDFAFTMFAAKRSRQRSLIAFVRMADYMLGSTLHTLLFNSCHSVVQQLQQRMCSLDARAALLDAHAAELVRCEAAAETAREHATAATEVRIIRMTPRQTGSPWTAHARAQNGCCVSGCCALRTLGHAPFACAVHPHVCGAYVG